MTAQPEAAHIVAELVVPVAALKITHAAAVRPGKGSAMGRTRDQHRSYAIAVKNAASVCDSGGGSRWQRPSTVARSKRAIQSSQHFNPVAQAVEHETR